MNADKARALMQQARTLRWKHKQRVMRVIKNAARAGDGYASVEVPFGAEEEAKAWLEDRGFKVIGSHALGHVVALW